ncbi:MAG: VWA domain-containing protein [Deltaproteobacteria bacterium]|nr:VWA domain-containing protein [Deltaproteobacteria bacterium]
MRLEGAKVESPFSPAVLVEHTWSAEEVVGRRIFAGFMPLLTPAGFASARTDQIDVVVPTLSLQSFDLTKSELADLSALGRPISRGGSVFEVGPDGSVSVDGASLGAGPTDPADLARVERVVPAANPVLFPRVRLSVKAEDATGLGVSRLGSDAFHVREDGEPKSFILRRNIAAPPRLLLLFDNSDSIPAEFRGAERVAMGADIASQLFALEPNAEVRVATVDFGISFQGSWAQSVADVQTQLESIAGTGSDLWYALEGAMEAEPTVVVLVTDGVASDVLEPSTRLRIAGHAPVVVLAVGAVDPVTVERIVDLTGGVAHFPGDGVAASGLVLDEIRARQSVHYELEYSSAATRSSTVTVQVDVGSRSGTTTFVAPTVSTPASRFSGLWITIETGGRQVRRKLAGHDGPVVIPPPLIDDAVLSDVEGALLSSTEIRVEGAPPPRACGSRSGSSTCSRRSRCSTPSWTMTPRRSCPRWAEGRCPWIPRSSRCSRGPTIGRARTT